MEKHLINNKFINALLIIMLLPIGIIFVFSFVYTNDIGNATFIGFNELFKEVRILEIVKICSRSIIVSSIATLFSFVLSYLLVVYTSKRFQYIFLILITLPFIANEAVRIFSWQNVLSESGLFNKVISYFFDQNVSVFSSANDLNIYVVMIITCVPFAIFICTGALKTIPEIYWKVSDDLQIGQLAKFLKVGLPLSKISILTSIVITFFIAFSLSSEVLFLGGATKISTRGFILSLMSANRYEAIFSFGVVILFSLIICYTIFLVYMVVKNTRKI